METLDEGPRSARWQPSVLLALQAALVASALQREALASLAAAAYREHSRHILSAAKPDGATHLSRILESANGIWESGESGDATLNSGPK
jgi:hypothetical protein